VKLQVDIHVLAGRFGSQQLAFAHLLDAAERAGLSPDFDHVEVIAPDQWTRLAHFFDADLAQVLRRAAGDDALILVLPGALITGAFAADARLRDLGRHPGTLVRAVP
jgi:hypothetical protein